MAADLSVTRYSKPGGMYFSGTGDFISVGGKVLGETFAVAALEKERASKIDPVNVSRHMRPMFYTGSPYGAELLELCNAD